MGKQKAVQRSAVPAARDVDGAEAAAAVRPQWPQGMGRWQEMMENGMKELREGVLWVQDVMERNQDRDEELRQVLVRATEAAQWAAQQATEAQQRSEVREGEQLEREEQ